MGAAIVLFSGLAAFALWWLANQRIGAKPWLEPGIAADARRPVSSPVEHLGLSVLLVSIASLFALFISAYLMRMQLADWRPAPKPTLLWFNTGLLMASGAAVHRARALVETGDLRHVRPIILVATGIAAAFVAGQIEAWRQLAAAGYGVTAGPAPSFFYVLTAVHAVHVVGGVIALVRTIAQARSGNGERLPLAVRLCTTYWDFLLAIWIILFGLLLLS